MPRLFLFTAMLGLILSGTLSAAEAPPALEPLVRVVDLDVGESAEVTLCNGAAAKVKLLDLKETRDPVCFAVRRAEVVIEINGQQAELVSANYHLPKTVGEVQIDCSITKGCNENGSPSFWGLDKDARLRLWPAGSPLLAPGTFRYPVKQKWFATDTQMANEPVFVDGGDQAGMRKIYYHSGLDIGGSEGLVEVIAATDALVVSVGDMCWKGISKIRPSRRATTSLSAGRPRLVLPLQPSEGDRQAPGRPAAWSRWAIGSACSAKKEAAAAGRICTSRSRAGSRRASGARRKATPFSSKRSCASNSPS